MVARESKIFRDSFSKYISDEVEHFWSMIVELQIHPHIWRNGFCKGFYNYWGGTAEEDFVLNLCSDLENVPGSHWKERAGGSAGSCREFPRVKRSIFVGFTPTTDLRLSCCYWGSPSPRSSNSKGFWTEGDLFCLWISSSSGVMFSRILNIFKEKKINHQIWFS